MAGSTTLLTQCGPFQKARGANQLATDHSNAYPARLPQTSEPSSAITSSTSAQQCIDIGHSPFGVGQNTLIVVPFGIGNDNEVFSVKILGWRRVNGEGVSTLWVPTVLAELTGCTLSATYFGVAGAAVNSNNLFCDTITAVAIGPTTSVEVTSPTGNLGIAHAAVAIKGFEKVEFIFDATTGMTSMNALVALI